MANLAHGSTVPTPAPHDHVVQLYESDSFLIDAVRDFIAPALRSGDTSIVIATASHRDALAKALKIAGIDLDEALRTEAYVALDANETLQLFMVDDMPDPALFNKVIGGSIAKMASGGRGVRAFGEMVAVLWAEGNVAAAIALEDLWNDLSQTHPFSLFCAYPMHAFDREASTEGFNRVCAQHSHVMPSESFVAEDNQTALLRNVAMLQQKANVGVHETEALRAKQMELEAALARLSELDRLRNDFIAMVVHDVRSPNAIVIGFLELLRTNWREFPAEQVDELLDRGISSARHVNRLVLDMLTVAKLEAREFTYDIRPVDLVEVIYRAVGTIREATSRRVEVEIEGAVPLVLADEARQLQVLDNLLNNAVKFSPASSPIKVSLREHEGEVILSVTDKGLGIPASDVPNLFQRFGRVNDPSHRSVKGTGLGLYISKALVEGQRGRIWVDSEVGKGTSFSYTVPVERRT